MFNRYRSFTLIIKVTIFLVVAGFSQAIYAAPFGCFQDLDLNGSLDGPGESASCEVGSKGLLCPINATSCTVNTSGVDVCPLGNYACTDTGSGKMCSSNICVDEALSPTVITDNIDGKMYADDGAKGPSGECLGVIMIFTGRAMTCMPPGKSNGFKNCCKNDGEMLFDSTGNKVTTSTIGSTAIGGAYVVAEQVYLDISAGMDMGLAAADSTAGVMDYMAAGFDPTTIAISIIIALAIDYFTQGCKPNELETSMLNSSGYCTYIGEYCAKKWLGECVQKERSFCCFNSKLARIIHEQGRPQLLSMGGFGSIDNPNCRGFTPEEFQALDFSKIDFSSYYADLRHDTDAVIKTKIEDSVNEFYDKIAP